ncbi:hypothetical protein E4T42_01143 [Aureobasidium subglaciale]|nr:hypothetical protein E4T42_01143 [Aureobasidium subglaciale]
MTTAPWQTGMKTCNLRLPSFTDRCVPGSPAFTAVTARRTLTRPAQATESPVQPQAAPVKIEWPQPVREYVQRAFADKANDSDDIDPTAVAAKLKSVITQAAESNLLAVIDWPSHPLPRALLRVERAKEKAALMSATKKRKSMDMDSGADSSHIPPWRVKNLSLADRITNPSPDKRQKKADQFRATAPPSKLSDLEKRRQRFALGDQALNSPSLSSPRDDSPMPDADDGPCVGTCQTLEKNYFRLTAPPKPETVRPLHILQQTLDLLIKKWKDDHNYGYICDQFKSLRQDLTVQHIKNDFTVRVYEAHARIALEKGDLGEYNQCQTQLRTLYKMRLRGSPGEFLAYRILYTIYTCNRQTMNDVLADLTSADKQYPAVKHALAVRASLATGNYHKFFRLFNESPNMGAYLMDMFVNRERVNALSAVCKVYRPGVKISFLTEELAFASDEQCAQYLCDSGAQDCLDEKPDGAQLSCQKASPIFEAIKNSGYRVDIKGQI